MPSLRYRLRTSTIAAIAHQCFHEQVLTNLAKQNACDLTLFAWRFFETQTASTSSSASHHHNGASNSYAHAHAHAHYHLPASYHTALTPQQQLDSHRYVQTLFWRTVSAAQRATVLVCDLQEAVEVSALHPFCRFHYDEDDDMDVDEEAEGFEAEGEEAEDERSVGVLFLSMSFVCCVIGDAMGLSMCFHCTCRGCGWLLEYRVHCSACN